MSLDPDDFAYDDEQRHADTGPHDPDPATDPPPGPVCPYCGGGPPVRTPLGTVCKSCARILVPRRPA